MVKFSSPEEPDYKALVHYLRLMASQAPESIARIWEEENHLSM